MWSSGRTSGTSVECHRDTIRNVSTVNPRSRLRALIGNSAAGAVLRRAQRALRQRAKARRRKARLKAVRRLDDQYDTWTGDVIRRVVSGDSNCIDVGAHAGRILREIVAAAPEGHHVAIEPLPEFAGRLRADFPSVEVLEVALSDHDGRSDFCHVVTAPDYSGLRLRPLDRPKARVERIEVVVRRLDDLVPADRKIRFVKIDVEGGEVDALRGGLATLARCRPYIAFEHGAPSAATYGSSSAELFDVLVGDIGLRISLLDDWLAGRPPLSRDEFIREWWNFFFLAHPEA
jgi:FkbM family methyltransferase